MWTEMEEKRENTLRKEFLPTVIFCRALLKLTIAILAFERRMTRQQQNGKIATPEKDPPAAVKESVCGLLDIFCCVVFDSFTIQGNFR